MDEPQDKVTVLGQVVGPISWQHDHLTRCPVLVMTLADGQILKLTGPAVTGLKRLVEACERAGNLSGPEFLDWVADRMVNVYGESAGVDFVLTARSQAEKVRVALAVLGEVPKNTSEV